MFEWMKKKKNKSPETGNGLNTLWTLYYNGELELRYKAAEVLCTYDSGVRADGHFAYFLANGNRLERDLQILRSILPKDLRENLFMAYDAFVEQGDAERCRTADTVFQEQHGEIDLLFESYVNKLGL